MKAARFILLLCLIAGLIALGKCTGDWQTADQYALAP